MNAIWRHVTDPRLVAKIMVERFEPDVSWRFFEPKIKPDLRIYTFVAVLFAICGSILLGMRIGGVNGMIASGSFSIGFIVCLALLYVKGIKNAIDYIFKTFDSSDIQNLLEKHPDKRQIIINNLDLHGLQSILPYVLSYKFDGILEAIFRSTNPKIPGTEYYVNNWAGSKAQHICRVVFDLKCEKFPEKLKERFYGFKDLTAKHPSDLTTLCETFPNDIQKIIDICTKEQLRDLIEFLKQPCWENTRIPANDTYGKIFKAIYFTSNPHLEGDSIDQIFSNVVTVLRENLTLPEPLLKLVSTYYNFLLPDEIPASSKLGTLFIALDKPEGLTSRLFDEKELQELYENLRKFFKANLEAAATGVTIYPMPLFIR